MEDKELEKKIELLAKHKLNNHLMNIGFVDFKAEHLLMKQRMEYIEKDIKEIKTLLKDFISTAYDKFGTKEDINKKNALQDKHIGIYDKVFIALLGAVGIAILGALLNLILK